MKSHAILQVVASAQKNTYVQIERGRVDYQCVEWSFKGPKEAAGVGDHGRKHLQVTQQIVVNWGSTEL